MSVYFITAIDTDAGKSIATGYMARYLHDSGRKVITQKMIQTGCEGIAEDLITHRDIMGIDLLPEDKDHTTCPQVFSYPASPHLAAEIDQKPVDLAAIKKSTQLLSEKYETVLLEGAGGLHVPLNSEVNIIDYVQQEKLPVILVTSSKLGSINHTLLSLEVLKNRGIEVKGVVYNHFPQKSEFIFKDSIKIFKQFLDKWYPEASLWELPLVNQMEELPTFEGL
ncbi:ATP-dependent dethiobiotin synthetase BioD [Prolixibacteraceae bacterium JC049]|jgi:dethiobiotin synthetase|nr:ATP-dependent dethiobiotin synthetase BioD [Prolixibacteraceae bacterium JC049]